MASSRRTKTLVAIAIALAFVACGSYGARAAETAIDVKVVPKNLTKQAVDEATAAVAMSITDDRAGVAKGNGAQSEGQDGEVEDVVEAEDVADKVAADDEDAKQGQAGDPLVGLIETVMNSVARTPFFETHIANPLLAQLTAVASPGCPHTHRRRPLPFALPSQIVERASDYLVLLEAPGVAPDAFEVLVSKTRDTLTVKGTKANPIDRIGGGGNEGGAAEEEGEKSPRIVDGNLRLGEFANTFALPQWIDSFGIEAALSDGILSVRVPKVDPPADELVIEVKTTTTTTTTA